MSVSENAPSGLTPHENPQGDGAPNQDLLTTDDLMALERDRIDSANRQFEVGREAIAANDRADERLFTFSMRRLDYQVETSRDNRKTSKTIIYVGGISLLAVVMFVLYNVFYGDVEQKEIALAIIKYFSIAVAGYGLFSGIAKSFVKFMKFRQEEGE